jgi:hypothetical protein
MYYDPWMSDECCNEMAFDGMYGRYDGFMSPWYGNGYRRRRFYPRYRRFYPRRRIW